MVCRPVGGGRRAAGRHHAEESFGPVIGIRAVAGEDEAIALMNDSDFWPDGPSSGRWTCARAAGGAARGNRHVLHEPLRLPRPGPAVDRGEGHGAGCDAVPPRLRALTQPKSMHLRTQLPG